MQRIQGEYDALLNKVNKVRQADKLPEQWMGGSAQDNGEVVQA